MNLDHRRDEEKASSGSNGADVAGLELEVLYPVPLSRVPTDGLKSAHLLLYTVVRVFKLLTLPILNLVLTVWMAKFIGIGPVEI